MSNNSYEADYKNIVRDVLENGEWSDNRTGIRTKSINGMMLKSDLREGFPILTSSKRGYKYVAAELECFIKGITDKRMFQNRNCHIWDEWCNPKKVPYAHDEETKKRMMEEPDLGKVYGYNWNNYEGSENKVIYISNDKFSHIKLADLSLYTLTKDDLNLQNILNKSEHWRRFKRSYNEECLVKIHEFWKYAYEQKCLCEEWIDYDTYIVDVVQLPQFVAFIREPYKYKLTPQYYKSEVYSKETCVFAANHQLLYNMSLNSETDKKDEDKIPVFALPVNQLKEIIDTARKDPSSRRLLCNAWHPCLVDEMSLTPCVYAWQLIINKESGYADLVYYQRSADLLLGVPANMSSYSMLLILLCKELGYTPRYVSAMMSNVHIYENHIEGAKILLDREVFDLPEIELTRFESIYTFEYTDFNLKNYKCGEKINFDVAI